MTSQDGSIIAELLPTVSGRPIVKREVPLERIKLGMMQGPGGDFFEHDMVDFVPLLGIDQESFYPGRRWCLDHKISQVRSDAGIRHPVVLVEGVNGYQPTTFDIGTTPETALWNVDRANEALGLTPADVRVITASTFGERP